ncbi:MAG TPA: hypothetical protein VFL81_00650 [Candidatus Saccharimonadales bacterium]|nr:hypothetical protein [Candidatus Saccharimonadales bacterium]
MRRLNIGMCGYTQETAQSVASDLNHLAQYPELGYVRLNIIYNRVASGSRLADEHGASYWVTFYDERTALELADKSELVQLKTKEGQRLDIIFPRASEREFQPARILIDGE